MPKDQQKKVNDSIRRTLGKYENIGEVIDLYYNKHWMAQRSFINYLIDNALIKVVKKGIYEMRNI